MNTTDTNADATPGDYDTAVIDQARELWRQYREGEDGRAVLLALFEAAADVARACLADCADHPKGCGCGHCSTPFEQDLRPHLVGLIWQTGQAVEFLRANSSRLTDRPPPADTWSEDIRRAAALAERWEAGEPEWTAESALAVVEGHRRSVAARLAEVKEQLDRMRAADGAARTDAGIPASTDARIPASVADAPVVREGVRDGR